MKCSPEDDLIGVETGWAFKYYTELIVPVN
jgi:hypothetical protein